MTEWYVIRHERPYDSEDAFIEAEGWTLRQKGMVLVGHAELPVDTPVRCYVTLATGVTLVKAEGVVTGFLEASGERPAGLEVKFRRIASETQKLIRRATRRDQATPARAQQYSLLDLELESTSEPEQGPVSIDTPPVASERAEEPSPPPPPPAAAAPAPVYGGSVEALRARRPGPVAAPANRNELLGRLRERRRSS